MTVEEAIALGRTWVDAGWKWAFGQVVLVQTRRREIFVLGVVTEVDERGTAVDVVHLGGGLGVGWGIVPDPRDPGFIGHALAQVREAWGRPNIYVEFSDGYWWVGDGDTLLNLTGIRTATEFACELSEAEALLAARKAAP